MKLKLVTTTLLTAALSIASMSAQAGLILTGKNLDGDITVTCNGNTAVPIPQNSSTQNLPWIGVWYVAGKKHSVDCSFTNIHGNTVGAAHLEIAPTMKAGAISNLNYDEDHYIVTKDKDSGEDITVTVEKK